jgi:predicted amino acid racemase
LTSPRLEIDLSKIRHNARMLVTLLGKRGISVSGVTKAFLGLPDVARELLAAGVSGLADSRIENIQTMRRAAVKAHMTLIRSPMIGQAALVVRTTDTSLNTELDVISELSKAAHDMGRVHGVLLMVELGDLREGIMPADLEDAVRRTLRFPNIALMGIGTNLACRCGVVPDMKNMGELTHLPMRLTQLSASFSRSSLAGIPATSIGLLALPTQAVSTISASANQYCWDASPSIASRSRAFTRMRSRSSRK